MTLDAVLGIVAVLIAVAGYAWYVSTILRGGTRPHAYSWLVWSLLTAIAFAIQVLEGAGPGAWLTGADAAITLLIFVLALVKGGQRITRGDTWALVAALAALGLWLVTDQPLLAVLLIIATDFCALLPTVRKGLAHPDEEDAALFAFSALQYLVALAALGRYAPTTWLYPAAIALFDGSFALLLWTRQKRF